MKSMRDEPGTEREYETIIILKADSNSDQITTVNSKIRSAIESRGGRVLALENWGKRKLAYEIQKQLKGIYLYWQYLGTQGLVEEIERTIRLLDQTIRYSTVKVGEDVDPKARPAVDEETYHRAATTVPDEEELATRPGLSRFNRNSKLMDEFDPELEELALGHSEESSDAYGSN